MTAIFVLIVESNLAELLEQGYDVSVRDVAGKTAYMLADEAGTQANKDAIGKFVYIHQYTDTVMYTIIKFQLQSSF